MPGTLFVVATPIGNLEDITVRALRVLREVAVIAAEDTRRTSHLLARHAIATPTTSLHEHNEGAKSASLIARLQRGESIALVSDAGTPAVSDPGGVLIRAAIDAGVRVEPIPGPSAVLAALSASGLPMSSFTFLGFPPTRSKDRKSWFKRLAEVRGTIIFFEAPHRIKATLGELARLVGDCEAAICRELTKIHETFVRGPISMISMEPLEERGEFTVVVFLGHTTDNTGSRRPSSPEIAHEFCVMTKNDRLTKRAAISDLARKHGMSTNQVYGMLEETKKLVE